MHAVDVLLFALNLLSMFWISVKAEKSMSLPERFLYCNKLSSGAFPYKRIIYSNQIYLIQNSSEVYQGVKNIRFDNLWILGKICQVKMYMGHHSWKVMWLNCTTVSTHLIILSYHTSPSGNQQLHDCHISTVGRIMQCSDPTTLVTPTVIDPCSMVKQVFNNVILVMVGCFV